MDRRHFADLAPKDVRELMRLLAKTKGSAQRSAQGAGDVRRSGDRGRLRGRIQQPRAGAGESRADGRLGQRRRSLSRAASRRGCMSYGRASATRIDFFPAAATGPIVVFIHGGYWQALDGSFFSHLRARAERPRHHGCGAELRSVSGRFGRRHHRADARGLARTGKAWPAARDQRPFRRRASCGLHAGDRLAGARSVVAARNSVTAAYADFGPVRPAPLVETSINKALRLDDASARAASPLFWKPPRRGSLDAVVGGNESAEYFRQSRSIVEPGARWARHPLRHGCRAPIILPRSRRSPTRIRRWCSG